MAIASGMGTGRIRLRTLAFLIPGLCLLMSSEGLARTAVFINEVMASNSKTLADPQGQFDDWIELYNADRVPIDVGGMYLTDDVSVPRKWQIPVGQPGVTTIGYRGFLIVWADGDVKDAGLHAGFRLSADGEAVYLFAADGVTLLDSLAFGRQTPDVSYGRYPDGTETVRFFGVPTPGRANNEGYQGEVAPLRFSHERGFYDGPFDLTITTATDGAQILYTTDGKAPNQAGYRAPPGRTYSGPIHISATVCLRVMALKPGWKPTPIYAHTYIFDSRAELRALPVVSLVGDPAQTFYEPNGVMAIVGGTYSGGVWTATNPGDYDNFNNHELERPVSAEWMYWADDAGFQADCGLRVHGSSYMRPRYTRQNGQWSGTGKISLRLYFRGEYGLSRLAYPLIPASGVEQFATVVLRAGHNDPTNPFIKDELLRRLHKDMGQAACLGTFANLFVAGEYKGYYNPTEQVSEEACQQWFDSDQPWDVMTMSGIRDGDSLSFDAMVTYARNHNLADPTYYAEMCRKLDVVSFIDYLIIRLWPNDWDWPQNNWSAACERSATGQWKFFLWDAEGTFETSQLSLDRFNELNIQSNANGYLYRALKASPDFRLLFADRVYQHFYNNGALTDTNIQKRFYELRDTLRSVILSMNTYIIDTWTPNRFPIFLNACIREGMYTSPGPDLAINGFAQHGGQVSPGDQLSMTLPGGRGVIYYTLDGNDPVQSDLQGLPITMTLVTRDMPKHILVPAGSGTGDWRGGQPFDDSSWPISSGLPGGVGFGRGSGFEPYFSANMVSRMLNVNSSCYIRIPFRFDGDKTQVKSLVLQMQHDDGFVAYLNGVEVARRNFEGEPAWNSTATVSRDNAAAIVFEAIDISDQVSNLRQGDNVLAIQGLNVAANNGDFLIGVDLTGIQVPAVSNSGSRRACRGPVTLTRTTRVKARIVNGTTWSALADAVFAVGPVKENLRLSEIMYHPADTADPNTEYIELTNIGAEPINLSYAKFTRGIRFTFPDVNLAPHAFCVVVKDRAAFEDRYGPGLPVVGRYTGSLDDNGELLELQDAAGAIVHSFRYQDNWFRTTDGGGFSLTVRDPASAPVTSWSTPAAWRPSAAPGGSPGSDDNGVVPEAGAVVISELLASASGGGSDWIELYNATDRVIDIGGWFLSDDASNLTKYEIAPGTRLRPHAYRVLTENEHFGNPKDPGCHEPFGLGRAGESLYLCSGSQGRVTGYREHAKFGASDVGLTFGRYVDGAGGVHFVPLRGATPGAANADPAVGPVVLNEIMYHAASPGDVEYIVLQNLGDTEATLYDSARGLPWRIASVSGEGGIDLLLPQNPPIVMAPHGYLLLLKDRGLFLSRYVAPTSMPLLEWGMGGLRDAGDTVRLYRPGDLDNDIPTWISVDEMTYSDGSHPEAFPDGVDPWPAPADGQGQALVRIRSDGWADDPLNWQGAAASFATIAPAGTRQRSGR